MNLPKAPKVSVIVPNYNYARYLPGTIDSVLNQTYENIEIIVVDDGSKDDSSEVLAGYGSKIKVLFQQNQGVSAARNAGIGESEGEYIAFLDADDEWFPEKVEKQVEKFLQNEELGLVHAGLENIDDSGNVLSTELNGKEGRVSRNLLLIETVVLGGGSGFMIARKALDKVSGFDTRLSTSADWDFLYHIACHYSFGFVPEILLKYRIHSSNMHNNVGLMESDMMASYEKIFSDKNNKDLAIKRNAYGNLHLVLAGSYFQAGDYLQFVKHSIKSLWFTPRNFIYFLQYPKRLWGKKRK
jgi:glycosyltransferase involved in cell wall biosynthesis